MKLYFNKKLPPYQKFMRLLLAANCWLIKMQAMLI